MCGFLVETLALGQVFRRVLRFFLVNTINRCYTLIHVHVTDAICALQLPISLNNLFKNRDISVLILSAHLCMYLLSRFFCFCDLKSNVQGEQKNTAWFQVVIKSKLLEYSYKIGDYSCINYILIFIFNLFII